MAWPTKTTFVDGDVLTAAEVNNIGDNLNIFNPTAATNGQVWIANGSGSGAYGAVGGGMTQITSGSLAGITSITLGSIPGTYRTLQLWMFDVYASALGTILRVSPNNQNFANAVALAQDSGAATTAVTSAGSATSGACESLGTYMTNNINARSQWIYTFPNYYTAPSGTSSAWHIATCEFAASDIGTGDRYTGMSTARLANVTSAITSIVIDKSGAATITAGTYILWGIR